MGWYALAVLWESPKRPALTPCPGLTWGWRSGRDQGGGTHRAGLVPKEMDGVEAFRVQAVQAVAFVPALREHVKADHASCRVRGTKPAEWLTVSVGKAPRPSSHPTALERLLRPRPRRGPDRGPHGSFDPGGRTAGTDRPTAEQECRGGRGERPSQRVGETSLRRGHS